MAIKKASRVFVYPWQEASLGSKEISKGLGIRRIRLVDSKFVMRDGDAIINWGASSIDNPEVKKCRLINTPTAVDRASNKLAFFKAMSEAKDPPRIPPFTDTVDESIKWVRDGDVVVARTKLRARSGSDIVFFDDPNEFVKAPLYTKYIKKKEEYRIHVAFGEVITVQQKALRSDVDRSTVDFRVRNLKNGFIFKIHDLHTPDDVLEQAVKAMVASNLHFGAVDVIFNEHEGKSYVLEINTAPGIEGSTVKAYIEAFQKHVF